MANAPSRTRAPGRDAPPPSPDDEEINLETEELQPPTEEYVRALRTEKQAEYGEADKQIDDMRAVRTQSKGVQMPDGLRFVDVEVRDPTITDEIQRVVATLTLNRPKLTVTATRPGDTGEKNATLREKWTLETLWRAGSRIAGQQTFRQAVDACTGDGGAWTKLLFMPDTWEQRWAVKPDDYTDEPGRSRFARYEEATEEAKKAAGPPFAWLNVDVRTVYPVWAGGVLAEVLEVSDRPLHQALRQYRLRLDKQGRLVPAVVGLPMSEADARRMPRTVRFLEHWDKTWCSYVIEGGHGDARLVRRFKHGYGRVPYFFAPGFTFNWMNNVKCGWGISQAKKWLVEYIGFLYTAHAQQAARETFAPIYRTVDPKFPLIGKAGEPKGAERYGLGQIFTGPPGSDLKAFPFPTTSVALKEQISLISERLDRLLTPRVTGNIGSNVEGAGFAINQLLSEVRIYQDPLAQSIEAMLEDVTRFLWSLVRTKVQETVWVAHSGDGAGWLGAGPDDLTDGVGIRWELDPERPSAKLIEERYWHERVQNGTASLAMAIEAMGDNPDEVRYQRDLEALRQEDWYVAYRREQLLKEVGRGDLLAKAAELAGITGGLPGLPPGVGGGPQAMGAPGGGPQDMGALAASPGGGDPAAPPQGTQVAVPMQSAAPGVQSLAA